MKIYFTFTGIDIIFTHIVTTFTYIIIIFTLLAKKDVESNEGLSMLSRLASSIVFMFSKITFSLKEITFTFLRISFTFAFLERGCQME